MTVAAPADGAVFRVLAVCTGNVCRSPALEVRLRAALGPTADVAVSSAGVRALAGDPVDPAMAALLGPVPEGWRARQLAPEFVRDAGLVLTMSRDQRRSVVSAVPAAVRRTFTLREFADLASAASAAEAIDGALSPGRALAELVGAAPRFRGDRSTEGDDIEDPYGQGPEVFQRVLSSIEAAVGTLAATTTGDRSVRR